MKNLSLKLQDALFTETEDLLVHLNMNRNAYLNEAIAFYNRYQKRRLLAARLRMESMLVADTSMEVLAEMEAIADEQILQEN
jgi:hypothetical protein